MTVFYLERRLGETREQFESRRRKWISIASPPHPASSKESVASMSDLSNAVAYAKGLAALDDASNPNVLLGKKFLVIFDAFADHLSATLTKPHDSQFMRQALEHRDELRDAARAAAK